MTKFPFLASFDYTPLEKEHHGRFKAATLVGEKYSKQKPTPISDLLDILKDPAKSQNQRFVVKGYILSFNNYKVTQVVKKVVKGKVLGFEESTQGEQPSYIFHFIATLKDSSVENDPSKSLNIYILTNEEDQHLFDLWEILPPQSDTKRWKSVKQESFNDFEEKLHGLTTQDLEVKMVVELLITQSGKAFFKLYDTIFI